eukprot:TRINITY_DN18649_c0_g1_i1.p1 TRINITY_DN18649_c0_g1~~TRINITY_DN18649_c0_g1_i1.p1  ORF type:complete len:418 (-),score=-6.23 TRINITY_DN18649_c0_g1_i1:291-1397(-)
MVYCFHMHLFCFISGYVVSLPDSKPAWRWLLEKITQLVVPYFAWFALTMRMTTAVRGQCPHASVADCMQLIIDQPDWGLWFLWCLFHLQTLWLVAKRFLEPSFGPAASAVIIVYGLDFSANRGYWWFDGVVDNQYYVRKYIAFFLAGYVWKRQMLPMQQVQTVLRLLLDTFRPLSWLVELSVYSAFWFFTCDCHRSHPPDYVPREWWWWHIHCVGMLGITMIYFVARRLSLIAFLPVRYLFNALCYLGQYSLDIYVIHQNLLYRRDPATGPYVNVFVVMVTSIVQSLLVSLFFLRKVSLLAMVFLGVMPPWWARMSSLTPSTPVIAEDQQPSASGTFANVLPVHEERSATWNPLKQNFFNRLRSQNAS